MDASYIDSGDSADKGRFAVGHVADGADVDGGLAGDNLGGEGGEGRDIHLDVLHREMGLGLEGYLLSSDELGSGLSCHFMLLFNNNNYPQSCTF